MKRLYIVIVVFLVVGCRNISDNMANGQIANESWNRDSIVNLYLNVPDAGEYRMNVNLRHSVDYPYENFVCYIYTNYPDSTNTLDTLNLKLVKENGKWIGQGLKGLKTFIAEMDKTFVLDSVGKCAVEIKHAMEDKDLTGVKNIGITFEKVK